MVLGMSRTVGETVSYCKLPVAVGNKMKSKWAKRVESKRASGAREYFTQAHHGHWLIEGPDWPFGHHLTLTACTVCIYRHSA